MNHILVFGRDAEQLNEAAQAFNSIEPGCARVGQGLTAPFETVLRDWLDGYFSVLLIPYNLATGFRVPPDTRLMMLDLAPDDATLAQCLSRIGAL